MSKASDGATVLGLVGDEDGSVAAACDEAGVDHVTGPPASVLDAGPSGLVAVGEAGIRSVALADPSVPVLPVEAGRGLRSVPVEDVAAAIRSVRDGAASIETHPVLGVAVGGETRGRALYDVMAVTAAPAHISEYRVTHDGEVVASFRADGVVAAPPAGTPEYASAAGSPVVPVGPRVCTVVPVAPFATTLADWVLPLEALGLEVLRETAEVDLIVDGERVCALGVDAPVTLTTETTVACYRVPAGRSPFAGLER